MVIENLSIISIICLCYARDIIYFLAGTIAFIPLMCSISDIKNDTDRTGRMVYIICCFIVWCWLYSKLIVL